MKRRSDFLVFGAPQIGQAEIDEVVDSMRVAWLGTGPKTAAFEAQFGAYKRSPHAVGVNSCTAALQLALSSLGIGAGDEVITTPLTFCATANAILHTGATPVIADVDPQTMNIDPRSIEERITTRTAAVMPVHFAGRPCAMTEIKAICARHDLRLIEDCAHAVESEYRGTPAGTMGDVGCFSFYATKNVTTGEGGMLITGLREVADRAKTLALHGMSKDAWRRFSDAGYQHYLVERAGYKFNMMDIQAAIGIHQLERVERSWKRREAIWSCYQDAFTDLPIVLPADVEPDTRHAHHLYTVLVDEARCGVSRDAFLQAMTERRIGVGVHYLALPEHPYYQRELGWRPDDVPHATAIGRETVSLPLSPALSDDDCASVIDAVHDVLGR